jgi:polysaccharide deacetylase family protein (PEP-CTERM system associated)
MRRGAPPHAFTVDVEEYFHVNAFDRSVTCEDWTTLPSRAGRSVDEILELLARHDATATFFVLGWLAERHPEIPKRIAAAGHEIGSHGWWHRRVVTLTPDQFRAEVRDCKRRLEDLTGHSVVGFRAPSFSILPPVDWAYDVLIEEGYAYDSSVFPIRRRNYGTPNACPDPHVVERPVGTLVEFPMATRSVAGFRIPGAGGAYLRLLPFALTRGTLRAYSRQGKTAIFYTHPWEIDPDQPRLDVPLLSRVRHYGMLARTRPRLEQLLAEFRFASIAECHGDLIRTASSVAVAPSGSSLHVATQSRPG